MALQKLDLPLNERIDTGKAVPKGSRQCGIALQQRLLPKHREQGLPGTFLLKAQAKICFSQWGIFDQFLVSCSDSYGRSLPGPCPYSREAP
jgi:hypothetical protein